MSSRRVVNAAEIAAFVRELPEWTERDGRIDREFEFGDFREAVAFIVRVGFEAEALNHHPELRNVYNRVGVSLTTHDAGNKLTEMDFSLARAIQRIADDSGTH